MSSFKGCSMEIDEIKKLMTELEESKLHKIVYKKGDFEIHLEKQSIPAPVAQPIMEECAAPQKPKEETAGSFVTSPMVGTFYAAAAPDHPPFVKVGDTINEGTVVCIIEAMKVMNEVKAGVNGTVAEIISHNGQAIEFGSRLFRVIP